MERRAAAGFLDLIFVRLGARYARGSPSSGAVLRTEDGVILPTSLVDAQVNFLLLSSRAATSWEEFPIQRDQLVGAIGFEPMTSTV